MEITEIVVDPAPQLVAGNSHQDLIAKAAAIGAGWRLAKGEIATTDAGGGVYGMAIKPVIGS